MRSRTDLVVRQQSLQQASWAQTLALESETTDEKVWQQPDFFVAARVREQSHQVRNRRRRLMLIENLGKWSVATWPNGHTQDQKSQKTHLWICVDEATKFTVGQVWTEGSDGDRVLELLQERERSVFVRVHILRTEQTDSLEGAWRNNDLHGRLTSQSLARHKFPAFV